MADVNRILTAFRDELVAAGIVRKPSVAGDLPPMHVEPPGGAPAPGDLSEPKKPADDPANVEHDAELVITVSLSGDLGEAPLDTYRRRSILDVRYRSRGTAGLQRARQVDDAIRRQIVTRPDYGLGWTMAAGQPSELEVLSTALWAGLGRIAATEASGYDELAKYMVEVKAYA